VIDLDPDRARELLQQERDRVVRELEDLRSHLGGDSELSTVDQHTADGGTELFEEERDLSIIERLEWELAAIERAFKRIEEGGYGLSVESGEPIPEKRLLALPHAERTVEEQARLDAQQRNASS
jgi:DnaK suppressor protein